MNEEGHTCSKRCLEMRMSLDVGFQVGLHGQNRHGLFETQQVKVVLEWVVEGRFVLFRLAGRKNAFRADAGESLNMAWWWTVMGKMLGNYGLYIPSNALLNTAKWSTSLTESA